MKKQAMIIGMLLLALLRCGCEVVGLQGETTPAVTIKGSNPEDEAFYASFFDLEMTHRPTEEEVAQVYKGMAFYDVIELLGKPHRPLRELSSGGAYEWELSSGKVYAIAFSLPTRPDGWDEMSAEEQYSYMKAALPRVVDFFNPMAVDSYTQVDILPAMLFGVSQEAFSQGFGLLAAVSLGYLPDCDTYQYWLDDLEDPSLGYFCRYDSEGRGFHVYVSREAFVSEYEFSAGEIESSAMFFYEYELYRLADPDLDTLTYAKLAHSGYFISLTTVGLTEEETLSLIKSLMMRGAGA